MKIKEHKHEKIANNWKFLWTCWSEKVVDRNWEDEKKARIIARKVKPVELLNAYFQRTCDSQVVGSTSCSSTIVSWTSLPPVSM